MKRTIPILLALLLLLPLACTPAEKETVTMELHEVTRSVFYAPQYIAMSLGFFEEEGLHVEITTSGGSEKAMTALLSGDADLCLAGPETGVYVMNEGKEDHPVIVGQRTPLRRTCRRELPFRYGDRPVPRRVMTRSFRSR